MIKLLLCTSQAQSLWERDVLKVIEEEGVGNDVFPVKAFSLGVSFQASSSGVIRFTFFSAVTFSSVLYCSIKKKGKKKKKEKKVVLNHSKWTSELWKQTQEIFVFLFFEIAWGEWGFLYYFYNGSNQQQQTPFSLIDLNLLAEGNNQISK